MIFEQLRAEQNNSDETTTALALAIMSKVSSSTFFQQTADVKAAEALLLPLVQSGRATRTAKLALANLYAILAHSQDRLVGLQTCETARKILADMGALDMTDLTAASIYGDVTDTQARIAQRLGRLDDAEKLATIVGEVAEKVLEQRPGDLQAMINRGYSANVRGNVAETRNRYSEAEAHYLRAVEAGKNYVLFNPADTIGWRGWNGSNLDVGAALYQQGLVAGAMQQYRIAAAREKDPRNKAGVDITILEAWQEIEYQEAQLGNLATARTALAQSRRVGDRLIKERAINRELTEMITINRPAGEFEILAVEGNFAAIHSQAAAILEGVARVPETSADNKNFRHAFIRDSRVWLIESALRLKRVEEAITVARETVANPLTEFVNEVSATRTKIRDKVRLGRALAAAGQLAEARSLYDEALSFYRKELAEGANGTNFTQHYARALYHSAMAAAADEAGRARRLAELNEAMTMLGKLSVEAQQLHDSRELIKWVTDARRDALAGE